MTSERDCASLHVPSPIVAVNKIHLHRDISRYTHVHSARTLVTKPVQGDPFITAHAMRFKTVIWPRYAFSVLEALVGAFDGNFEVANIEILNGNNSQ